MNTQPIASAVNANSTSGARKRFFRQIVTVSSFLLVLGGTAAESGTHELDSPRAGAMQVLSSLPDAINVSGNGIHVRLQDGGLESSRDGVAWEKPRLTLRTFLRGLAYGRGVFVAVGGSYVDEPAVIMTSRDGVNWRRRTAPSPCNLYSVTWGAGQFVAVGDNGAICTSADGFAWRSRRAATPHALLASVTWGHGLYVVGGESGLILTSSDAVRWRQGTIGTACYIGRLTCSEGGFVARSHQGIFASIDGLNWIRNAELDAPALALRPGKVELGNGAR